MQSNTKLSLFVLIFIILAAGFYWYFKDTRVEEKNQALDFPQNEVVQSEQVKYFKEELGFSFSYPASYFEMHAGYERVDSGEHYMALNGQTDKGKLYISAKSKYAYSDGRDSEYYDIEGVDNEGFIGPYHVPLTELIQIPTINSTGYLLNHNPSPDGPSSWSDGLLVGVFNLESDEFPVLIFHTTDIPEEEFIKIMQSINIWQPNNIAFIESYYKMESEYWNLQEGSFPANWSTWTDTLNGITITKASYTDNNNLKATQYATFIPIEFVSLLPETRSCTTGTSTVLCIVTSDEIITRYFDTYNYFY